MEERLRRYIVFAVKRRMMGDGFAVVEGGENKDKNEEQVDEGSKGLDLGVQ